MKCELDFSEPGLAVDEAAADPAVVDPTLPDHVASASTLTQGWQALLASVRSVPQFNTVAFGGGTLLAVAAGSPREVICVRRMGEPYVVQLDAQPTVLASYERLSARMTAGRAAWTINEHTLSSWLAFIDASLAMPSAHRRVPDALICERVTPERLESDLTFAHWLALDILRGEAGTRLIAYLRSSESYRLAGYLLSNEPADERHLRELGQRYGVSYSHFRRLCHRAFGGAAKSRLRAWRAARAALQLIDGRDSVLQVAMCNGYTSASHITNDIKKLYGVTPSVIKNAHVLLP
ncbi:helix-turn-helix domain-containing protein [Burkholderia ambifaria]|uniref:helix-turn-helix domain-containing protein n=1 Tax=Burkholderia ambifaria TaxID=152480 RepID=UPI0015916D22|nr:helix-turn-helix domain-containing protein [Burkholderia ambifaria]